MRNPSIKELLDNVDTTYLTEQDKAIMLAQAEASQYALSVVKSATAWAKNVVVSLASALKPVNTAHS